KNELLLMYPSRNWREQPGLANGHETDIGWANVGLEPTYLQPPPPGSWAAGTENVGQADTEIGAAASGKERNSGGVIRSVRYAGRLPLISAENVFAHGGGAGGIPFAGYPTGRPRG